MTTLASKKLNELSIIEAIDGLKSGSFTSVELTAACLSQIEKYDGKIKAFLLVNKEGALTSAKKADELIKSEGASAFAKYPLLGIPYACKDNFNTKGIETTAASNVLKGYIPPYESTVSQKLKDAGAVMLGKTNMDAFAHGSSGETSDFQQTTNPWDCTRIPGGSSAGSAAAVSANMCIFVTGSETAGSIRGPAAWCGVVGVKPTYGRVSRYGLIAMCSSTDSPGPITKTVEDGGYVLSIIAGKDPFDATSSPKPVEDYFTNLPTSIKGLKIGRPKSYFEINLEADVKKASEGAIAKFKELGAEIIDMDLLDPKYSIADYTVIQRSEVSSNLARFTGVRYGQDRTAFGFEAKKRMMLGAYTLSAGYYDAYYSKAQKVRTLIVDDFAKAFEQVDLIIGPTMPCVALKFGEASKSPMFGEIMDVLAEPSSIAGIPGISFNGGFSNGLPIGVNLMGPQFSERKLVEAVNIFEKNTDFSRKLPDLKE